MNISEYADHSVNWDRNQSEWVVSGPVWEEDEFGDLRETCICARFESRKDATDYAGRLDRLYEYGVPDDPRIQTMGDLIDYVDGTGPDDGPFVLEYPDGLKPAGPRRVDWAKDGF